MKATIMVTGAADIAASLAGERPVTVTPSGNHLIRFSTFNQARAAIRGYYKAVKFNGQKMAYDSLNGSLIFGDTEISILK